MKDPDPTKRFKKLTYKEAYDLAKPFVSDYYAQTSNSVAVLQAKLQQLRS